MRLLKIARSPYITGLFGERGRSGVMRRLMSCIWPGLLWIRRWRPFSVGKAGGEPQAGQTADAVMAIEAIYQKPNTSKGHPDHKVYPYLLRGLTIDRPNQVVRGHHLHPDGQRVCLSGGGNGLFSRRSCRGGCRSSWRRIFASSAAGTEMYGPPEIFNTDQGVQFTSAASWTNWRAAAFGSAWTARAVFGQYFHRTAVASLKYEDVYIKAYARSPRRAGALRMAGVLQRRTPHQSLDIDAARNFEASPLSMWTTLPHRARRSCVAHILTGTSTGKEVIMY